MELAHRDTARVTRKSGKSLVNIDQLGLAKCQVVILPFERQQQIKNAVSSRADDFQAAAQFTQGQARMTKGTPHGHCNRRKQLGHRQPWLDVNANRQDPHKHAQCFPEPPATAVQVGDASHHTVLFVNLSEINSQSCQKHIEGSDLMRNGKRLKCPIVLPRYLLDNQMRNGQGLATVGATPAFDQRRREFRNLGQPILPIALDRLGRRVLQGIFNELEVVWRIGPTRWLTGQKGVVDGCPALQDQGGRPAIRDHVMKLNTQTMQGGAGPQQGKPPERARAQDKGHLHGFLPVQAHRCFGRGRVNWPVSTKPACNNMQVGNGEFWQEGFQKGLRSISGRNQAQRLIFLCQLQKSSFQKGQVERALQINAATDVQMRALRPSHLIQPNFTLAG